MAITNKVPFAGLHHLRWKQCQRECEKLHYWTWTRGFQFFLFFWSIIFISWLVFGKDLNWYVSWLVWGASVNRFFQLRCRDPMKAKPSWPEIRWWKFDWTTSWNIFFPTKHMLGTFQYSSKGTLFLFHLINLNDMKSSPAPGELSGKFKSTKRPHTNIWLTM